MLVCLCAFCGRFCFPFSDFFVAVGRIVTLCSCSSFSGLLLRFLLFFSSFKKTRMVSQYSYDEERKRTKCNEL